MTDEWDNINDADDEAERRREIETRAKQEREKEERERREKERRDEKDR